MNRLILVTMLVCLSLSVIAQETTAQKEVGIAFSSLDNFGLSFKAGTSQAMWRFNTLLISGSHLEEASSSIEDLQNTAGFTVRLGKEYRKEVAENIEFRF